MTLNRAYNGSALAGGGGANPSAIWPNEAPALQRHAVSRVLAAAREMYLSRRAAQLTGVIALEELLKKEATEAYSSSVKSSPYLPWKAELMAEPSKAAIRSGPRSCSPTIRAPFVARRRGASTSSSRAIPMADRSACPGAFRSSSMRAVRADTAEDRGVITPSTATHPWDPAYRWSMPDSTARPRSRFTA